MELLPFIVFILVWYFVVKYYRKKGYGVIVRHLAGFAVGLLGLIVTILTVMPKPEAIQQQTIAEPKQKQAIQEVKEVKKEVQKVEQEISQTVESVMELEKVAEEKQEPIKEENKPTQTLDLDITKFATRIDKALKNAQSPFKMATQPKVIDGEVNDVANYMFTDNFGVIITLDKKTHKVKSLSTIVIPTSNTNDNLVMVFSSAAVLSAFEGENEIKTVAKKVIELTQSVMQEYAETKETISKSFIFNGKEYGVSASQYTGIMSYADFAD